jgi:hypothetical protein
MPETAVAEKSKRSNRKDYTDQEIDMGLTAYAITSGKQKRAAELVKEQAGLDIPHETIRSWAQRTHPDRYERIRTEVAPKLQQQMADTHQALAHTAAELEARAVEKLETRLKTGEVEDRDLANIFKSAAIAGGIHVEKAQLLNDRPTQIVQRSASEVLRKLKSKGVVIEAEVVEETTVEAIGSGSGA